MLSWGVQLHKTTNYLVYVYVNLFLTNLHKVDIQPHWKIKKIISTYENNNQLIKNTHCLK